MEASILCGQLLVVGFDGHTLPPDLLGLLSRGERGGVILFKRNLPADVRAVRATTIAAADCGADLPPFVCIDQEGGRVARLGAPVLRLPSMLALARAKDELHLRAVAAMLGRDLRHLGFSSGLAPILDVHSNPTNPIIGDRSFGESAEAASRLALLFAEGLSEGGVAPCGKHFPGHGDTTQDSHFELPTVSHSRARLDEVELRPFAAAARAGIASLMTAHVLYPSLDPERPATLSPLIASTILRTELGFRGVLFSDDLEMKALKAPVEETAVAAIRAGCDVLLVCSRADLAARAHHALVGECDRDPTFRRRCEEAFERFAVLRRAFPPRPERSDAALEAHFASPEHKSLEAWLASIPAAATAPAPAPAPAAASTEPAR